jgi:hypothetical protein
LDRVRLSPIIITDLDLTLSPNLTVSTFAQYDTESDSVGTNSRLRWDFTPQSRLFFVVNIDFEDPGARNDVGSYGTSAKFQHEFRF